MTLFISIVHILAALFMILVVLLQSGKGAGMGAAFGGSSQTTFGGGSGMSFMGKLTATAATVFMLTSMTLAYMASSTSSLVDDVELEAPAPVQEEAVPAMEAQPAEESAPAAQAPEAAAPADGAAPKIVIQDKDGNPVPGITVEKVDPKDVAPKAEEAPAEKAAE